MIGYSVGLIGMWILSDAILSITLYLNAQSYDGTKQTWRKDHWVRLVRLICGIALIAIGAMVN